VGGALLGNRLGEQLAIVGCSTDGIAQDLVGSAELLHPTSAVVEA
jgi:hypothetical protein